MEILRHSAQSLCVCIPGNFCKGCSCFCRHPSYRAALPRAMIPFYAWWLDISPLLPFLPPIPSQQNSLWLEYAFNTFGLIAFNLKKIQIIIEVASVLGRKGFEGIRLLAACRQCVAVCE